MAGAAVVVVFIPVADAALSGLSLGLLAAGTVCFSVALLLLRGSPLGRRQAFRRRHGRWTIASGLK
jgi:hypothetical protein